MYTDEPTPSDADWWQAQDQDEEFQDRLGMSPLERLLSDAPSDLLECYWRYARYDNWRSATGFLHGILTVSKDFDVKSDVLDLLINIDVQEAS